MSHITDTTSTIAAIAGPKKIKRMMQKDSTLEINSMALNSDIEIGEWVSFELDIFFFTIELF